jgi:hypothetical protein
MPDVFVVLVEGNLVSAIERSTAAAGEAGPGSRLDVGTQLATNYRENRRIDGRYVLADAEDARSFALLCLEFTKGLVERRSCAVDALAKGDDLYYRAEQPQRGDDQA